MIKMGCFGSVVAFAPKRETCQKCDVQKQCAAEVFSREESTLRAIERKETERETDDATLFAKQYHDINDLPEAAYHKVKRLFVRRRNFTERKAKGQPVTRAERDFKKMVENAIQFDLIKMGTNPFRQKKGNCRDDDGIYYPFMAHAVDCLHDDLFIKAKDIADHYKRISFGTSPSGRATMARRAIKILELAQVIKNDGGTYCLS